MMKIYADNAATTKMSGTALEAMLPYMTEHFGNPSSLYTIGQEAKEVLETARADMADRRVVHRGAAARDLLHLRRQRGRQSGHPLGGYARREEGQKAHHLHEI